MSDTPQIVNEPATTPPQTVQANLSAVIKVDGGHLVAERHEDGWHPVSQVFPHSTSAYANLGRRLAKQMQEATSGTATE